jgi:hypothetical protein
MGYGVFQFPDDLYARIKVKAQWKWHNVLHNDFDVHLIRDVDLGVVLELLKIGRGKERQAMRFDSFVIEAVQHLDQSTIKHFEVIGLGTFQFVINIAVCSVFQRDTQVAFSAQAKFLDTTPYIPQRREILMVTHA